MKLFLSPVARKSLYTDLTLCAVDDRYVRIHREDGDLGDAIAAVEAGEDVLVHVQWEEFFFIKLKTAEQADAAAARAGRIIVHNAVSIALLVEQVGLSPDDSRLRVIAHPSYAGMYEPEGEAERQLRAAPSRPQQPFVLGFGRMRRQKGFDLMLDALDPAFTHRHGLRLRFSGTGGDAAKLRRDYDHRADVDWDLDYVPHAAVPTLFRDAACVVLPYRRVMTSGVAMLALTLGGVIVAPKVPTFLELLPPDLQRFLYDADDRDGLRNAVHDAAAMTAAESRDVRLAGIAVAEDLHPRRISAVLADLYAEVMSAR